MPAGANARPIYIVTGLGFGDEGKGTITDYLVRAHGAGLVVRHGGPQAAHHVTGPRGRRHCFAQFGSGTLVPGVGTLLSKHMLVEPAALLREARELRAKGVGDAFERLVIDRRCVVVTPFHRAVNRMRELARGTLRHGTCGLGAGEAQLDAESGALPVLRVGDLGDRQRLRRILRLIQMVKLDHGEQLAADGATPELGRQLEDLRSPALLEASAEACGELLRRRPTIAGAGEIAGELRSQRQLVFEGAQGILLDRDRGFWPHVSATRPGFECALDVLAEAGIAAPVQRIGVIRAYSTRHGEGPMVAEDPRLAARLPELDNASDGWQGEFRIGSFDAVATRYALRAAGGVDAIALTNLDRLAVLERVPICVAYEHRAGDPHSFFELASNGRVRDLRLPTQATRDHQSRLTGELRRCRPVIEEMPGWQPGAALSPPALSPPARAFVRRIEQLCSCRIRVVSSGPGAEHKYPLP